MILNHRLQGTKFENCQWYKNRKYFKSPQRTVHQINIKYQQTTQCPECEGVTYRNTIGALQRERGDVGDVGDDRGVLRRVRLSLDLRTLARLRRCNQASQLFKATTQWQGTQFEQNI